MTGIWQVPSKKQKTLVTVLKMRQTDRRGGGGGGGEQGHFLNLNYDGYNYAVEIEEKGHKY